MCGSPNPRNRRTRSSIAVEEGGTRLLVDASPDLRAQLLANGLSRFDAVLFTHAHADHIHGIDDLRSINHHLDDALDVYSDAQTLATIRERFAYAFEPNVRAYGWYKPELVPRELTGPARIGAIDVVPFEQAHGKGTTLGLRFGAVAYSTDVNALSEAAFAALDGVNLWIVDCLRPGPNPVHSHLEQTLGWIERVKPKRAILCHMNHELDYGELVVSLPDGVEPAYDGMVVDWPA